MLQIKKENYFNKIFIFIALLTSPILAIAPLGIWVPLIFTTLLILPLSKEFLISLKKSELLKVLVLTFLWILTSIFFIAENINQLEKFFHFFILIIAGLILTQNILKTTKFDKVIIVFAISFLLSSFLIIVDLSFSLGLKLWLSKNFDAENFTKFYQFKSWINFANFRIQESNLIINYLKSGYDRGILALTIVALPLCLICYNYKFKILAFTVLVTSLVLAFISLNLTVILNYFVAIPFAIFYYYKKNIFKKYFFFALTTYFIFSPFILGQFDYKDYSYYENTLLKKSFIVSKKYCDSTSSGELLIYLNNFNIYLKCGRHGINWVNIENNEQFNLQKKSDKFLAFLNHKMYLITNEKFHRLIIWSYAKEKILEKPFLGHGFHASRYISQELRQTDIGTNYQYMPLHPHNSILQVWLELGIIGIMIFLIFIKVLLNIIYKHYKISPIASTITIFSFFQIFITGQIAYGFWQSWWIAIIIIIFILYSVLFYTLSINELQSNSSN